MIDLLPYQYEFVSSDHHNLALLAGVGTGKTHALACFVLRMVGQYPKANGMIVANTHGQLLNATLTPLFRMCEDNNIPYSTAYGSKRITIMDTTIYVYSLEKYDNIRGIEVGWIAADEFFLGKDRKAYDVIKTRLRDKNGPLYFRAISTKNGFNWGYDMYSSPTKENDYKVIQAQTSDNPFLPEQYIDDLLEDYGSADAPMYRQEVLNEYVNLTAGSVYWSFDRKAIVQPTQMLPEAHTHVGVDFNIDQMSAVLCQMRGDTLYVCKEISLTEANSNTFTLASTLQKELFHFPYRTIVPDSTGKARKTSSQKSDHQILKDAGFTLDVTTNPPIRDRQNAVNRLFNTKKIVIDPSCGNLIKELETLAARDKEGDKVHLSVALGYVVHKLAPIVQRKKPQMIQR
jgi:phage terminase large subunit